jgi:hypothetical protein
VERTSPFEVPDASPFSFEVGAAQLAAMDADALAALGGLIDAIKEAKADACEPGTVFAWVEEDLRARMAVPIEPSLSESRR